jgi:hypothetical protein
LGEKPENDEKFGNFSPCGTVHRGSRGKLGYKMERKGDKGKVKAKLDLEQKVRTNRLLMIDPLIRKGKYPNTGKFASKLKITTRTGAGTHDEGAGAGGIGGYG